MRRSGRTTRIVDAAVQTLFERGEVTINDHHYGDYNNLDSNAHDKANKHAFKILLRRLDMEHGDFSNFKIDHKKCVVKLIK